VQNDRDLWVKIELFFEVDTSGQATASNVIKKELFWQI